MRNGPGEEKTKQNSTGRENSGKGKVEGGENLLWQPFLCHGIKMRDLVEKSGACVIISLTSVNRGLFGLVTYQLSGTGCNLSDRTMPSICPRLLCLEGHSLYHRR